MSTTTKTATVRRSAPLLVALIVTLPLAACSTSAPPRAELAAAETAIREAEDAGAPSLAAGDWARARDKYQDARQALTQERNLEARRLAEQALVDAKLATSRARTTSARQKARELERSIEALRDEAQRSAG